MKIQTSFISIIRVTLLIIVVLLISSHGVTAFVIKNNKKESGYTPRLETLNDPWENMGNDIRQVCDATYILEYEWAVTYNNASPIIRVTCNGRNGDSRVCPPITNRRY